MKQKRIRKIVYQWFQFGVLLTSLTINQTIFAQETVWESIEIINVNQVPWDDRFRMGKAGSTNGKLLFFNPEGGTLLYVQFNPGWDADGAEAHYHTFHEWG